MKNTHDETECETGEAKKKAESVCVCVWGGDERDGRVEAGAYPDQSRLTPLEAVLAKAALQRMFDVYDAHHRERTCTRCALHSVQRKQSNERNDHRPHSIEP